MDRHELAWAAGFFDGEGWANAVGQTGRRTRQPQAQINQSDNDAIPVALERFNRAVGVGRIGGPECKPGRMDRYWWIASSRSDVNRVAALLDPWLGDVKRREFDDAVGPRQRDFSPPHESAEWIAWAAGLYDGEGCSCLLDHRTHAGYKVPELSVTQSSAEGEPEVLVRFRDVVNAGHIDGPIDQPKPWLPVYRWKCGALHDVRVVLETIWPWLGPIKRAQAQVMLKVLDGQPVLPRGNPAWGNRKTHCVNGHEYTAARIRPYVPRSAGKQRRDSQQCLVCARDAARERYWRNKDRRPTRPPIDYRELRLTC
jgi:hypothetical protein